MLVSSRYILTWKTYVKTLDMTINSNSFKTTQFASKTLYDKVERYKFSN